jgi:hypothetical protein
MGWLLDVARQLAEIGRPVDPPALPVPHAPSGVFGESGGRKSVTAPRAEPAALDPEALKIITDLAGKEYANENDRTKVLDAKSGPLIGATGAAIAFLVGAITKPPDSITSGKGVFPWFYYGSLLAAIALLILAQLYFLRSVRVRRTFERFDLGPYATFESARRAPTDLYSFIAGTYTNLVAHNTIQNDEKARLQDKGLIFLLIGILLLIFAPATVVLAAIFPK